MPTARLPFGEFAPDQPGHGNPGLVDVLNAYPGIGGWRPVGEFSASANGTLAAKCLGANAFRASDGTSHTIAGTATNLYTYGASGWTSRGSGYTAVQETGWQFAAFGDLIICVHPALAARKFNMASPGAVAALGGSPPAAALIGTIREFVVLGRVGGDNRKLQTSGINNSESWTVGTNQSVEKTFPVGGDIMAIVPGEYGLIIQEKRVNRMTYVGGSTVFQIDAISSQVGAVHPNAVTSWGRIAFFLSDQGFMMCDGTEVTPIGNEKVDRTFAALASREFYDSMSCAVDPIRKIVMFTEPSADTPDTIWFYDWTIQQWGKIDQTAEKLFAGLSVATTLEDLDATYPSLDGMTASLDDPQWKGGNFGLYIFDSSHAYGTLSGQAKEATFTLGDNELAAPFKSRVRKVRPITDAVDGLTLSMRGRDRLGDGYGTDTATTLNTRGQMPVRLNNRYVSPSLVIAAGTDWTFAQGLDVEFEGGGRL